MNLLAEVVVDDQIWKLPFRECPLIFWRKCAEVESTADLTRYCHPFLISIVFLIRVPATFMVMLNIS